MVQVKNKKDQHLRWSFLALIVYTYLKIKPTNKF